MSRRPSRRRKPSPPKPNVSISLEQLESRDFPNDLFSLLGSALVSGGLSILGHAGASPRPRDPRDAESMAPATSSAPRAPEAAPPLFLTSFAAPVGYESRPTNNSGQTSEATPTAVQSGGADDALTLGLGDPLHHDAPSGGPAARGIQIPDPPPTGGGSFGIPSTIGGEGGTPGTPPTPAAGDYGSPRGNSPATTPILLPVSSAANMPTVQPVSSAAPASHAAPPTGNVTPHGAPPACQPPGAHQAARPGEPRL
jgi:hypothetical protein